MWMYGVIFSHSAMAFINSSLMAFGWLVANRIQKSPGMEFISRRRAGKARICEAFFSVIPTESSRAQRIEDERRDLFLLVKTDLVKRDFPRQARDRLPTSSLRRALQRDFARNDNLFLVWLMIQL